MKATLIFLSFLVQSLCFAQLASWNNDSFKELDKKSSNNLKMWNEGNQFYYEEVSRNQNANGEVEVILNDINGRSMQVRLTDKSSYWKFPNDANWTVLYDGSWSVKPYFETPQKTMQARLTKGQKKKIEEDVKSLEESYGLTDFNKLQQFRYDPKFKASLTPEEVKYYEDMIIENARIRRQIDIESFGENWKEERNNVVFINTYKKDPKYETKVEIVNSRQYLLYRLKPEITPENTTPVENNPAPVSNPIVNSTNSSVNHKPAVNIKSVQIGTQTWMAENLNVDRFRNGDPIPEAKTAEEWLKAGENKQPAWCYYDNNPVNATKYGKLYNWYAVNDPRGLAPAGWHVPSKVEFEHLAYVYTKILPPPLDIYGSVEDCSKLKSKQGWLNWQEGGQLIPCSICASWNEEYRSKTPCHSCKDTRDSGRRTPVIKHAGNGNNESGFSALPGGYADGNFSNLGDYGYWWSSNESSTEWYKWDNGEHAISYSLNNRNGSRLIEDVTRPELKEQGFSVRCVKD
jgi:uncharacterized protein (TIGR02145 family)